MDRINPTPQSEEAMSWKQNRAVENGMSVVEYKTWMFLADKNPLDEPYTFAVGQIDLTKFLQAAIRQAEVNRDNQWFTYLVNEVGYEKARAYKEALELAERGVK